jgi:hypothetical protein
LNLLDARRYFAGGVDGGAGGAGLAFAFARPESTMMRAFW